MIKEIVVAVNINEDDIYDPVPISLFSSLHIYHLVYLFSLNEFVKIFPQFPHLYLIGGRQSFWLEFLVYSSATTSTSDATSFSWSSNSSELLGSLLAISLFKLFLFLLFLAFLFLLFFCFF